MDRFEFIFVGFLIYWEQGGYATPEFDTLKLIEDFKKAMEE